MVPALAQGAGEDVYGVRLNMHHCSLISQHYRQRSRCINPWSAAGLVHIADARYIQPQPCHSRYLLSFNGIGIMPALALAPHRS